MKWRSELDVKKMDPMIEYPQSMLLVGSCFTEHIGEKLSANKFPVLDNPNGILFNPISISKAITGYVERKVYTEADLFYSNERWNSWDHHSRFSHWDKARCLVQINDSQQQAHDFLKQADWVFLTLGSAFVYELVRTGQVVANCHKAPGDSFRHRLLTVEELMGTLDNLVHRLFFFNPKIQIIFTISPVRHLREGMIENNRSKAALIQVVHHLVNKFNKLHYFPAYELLIDDLRDYRFYAEDLVHPNFQATQYVWEKLMGACLSDGARELIKELQPILIAARHKPFNPDAEEHKKFIGRMREQCLRLKEKYPFLDLEKELAYFGLCG